MCRVGQVLVSRLADQALILSFGVGDRTEFDRMQGEDAKTGVRKPQASSSQESSNQVSLSLYAPSWESVAAHGCCHRQG